MLIAQNPEPYILEHTQDNVHDIVYSSDSQTVNHGTIGHFGKLKGAQQVVPGSLFLLALTGAANLNHIGRCTIQYSGVWENWVMVPQ